MQIIKTLFWPLAITIPLAACGQHAQSSRPLPPAPYAYLSLTACRHYPSNIVECQLDYGTQFGRHRLGPVQQVSRDLATNLDGSRYQITACWPVSRVQRELPNFTCRISRAVRCRCRFGAGQGWNRCSFGAHPGRSRPDRVSMEAGSLVALTRLILWNIFQDDIDLRDKTCTPVIFFS